MSASLPIAAHRLTDSAPVVAHHARLGARRYPPCSTCLNTPAHRARPRRRRRSPSKPARAHPARNRPSPSTPTLHPDRLRRPRRPDRGRPRPRRRRVHHAVRHPDQGHPGRAHRSRRLRPGQDRLRQDAGLRRADARPAHRRGRAAPAAGAWSSCRRVSWRCRSPRCSPRSPPAAIAPCSPSTAGRHVISRSTR